MLNEYFTLMTSILLRHGATIDKYIGDSVMAFWGAPLPQEDHAHRAVMATFEMQEAAEQLSKEFVRRGWSPLQMGIGLNSGKVNVGNMGSIYRMAYTVIGDPVNLCARLEAMTRAYAVSTIVGQQTAQAIDEYLFRELDTVRVKGKTDWSHIYQPVCRKDEATPELLEHLARHSAAMSLYYADDYQAALDAFEALLPEGIEPAYYDYMIEQLRIRLDRGPPLEQDRRSRRRPELAPHSGSWTDRD